MAFNKQYPLKPLELLFKRFSLFVGQYYFDVPSQLTSTIDPVSVKRVLLLRYDKLGDIVVSLPMIEALRDSYPEIEIDVLASPRNERIIRDDPRISNLYLFTKNVFKDFVTILRMRKRKYDVVISMISLSSATSLHLSQLIGKGSIRIGLGQANHSKFYHYYLPIDHSLKEHMLVQTLRTLAPFGIDTNSVSLFASIHISCENERFADETLAEWRAQVESGRECIGVNISAGMSNRIWAEDHYAELISSLSKEYPTKLLAIFFAPSDREKAIRIQRRSGGHAALLPPGLDIMKVAALTKRLVLLITPDTSMTHIARSFQVPVIGLYSNHQQNTDEWRPYGQNFGLVQANAKDDIFDITVGQVVAEVKIAFGEATHV
ncbi:glycosyltransferase family 9 protein [Gemmatimonas aurantiaca]|nr:glycosyltransferase family 9 protein [Gemmatimonas aurantiaca]